MSKNSENRWKLMKMANIDRETLHNLWTTWGISMKFSGKTCLMIILKVTKKTEFHPPLEDIFFKKPQGGGSNWPLPPPPFPQPFYGQRKKIWRKEMAIEVFCLSRLFLHATICFLTYHDISFAMVLCSRFIWVTNSNDHRRVWIANLLHTK